MPHEHFSSRERAWYEHQAGGPVEPHAVFGLTLRRLRLVNDLTLRDLAGRIFYSHVYLWQVEAGVKPPTRPVAHACDRALDGDGVLVAIARGDLWRDRGQQPCPLCWVAIRSFLEQEHEPTHRPRQED